MDAQETAGNHNGIASHRVGEEFQREYDEYPETHLVLVVQRTPD